MDGAGEKNRGVTDPEGAEPHGHESWWQVFLHAVRGTGGDPTKGPLVRALTLLAVPMVLEAAALQAVQYFASHHDSPWRFGVPTYGLQ